MPGHRGEPVTFTNWLDGQPDNNTPEGEDYVHMMGNDRNGELEQRFYGKWNDYQDSDAAYTSFNFGPLHGVVEVAPPVISAEQAVEVVTPTMVGQLYQLQRTPTLPASEWTPVGFSFLGDGGQHSFFDRSEGTPEGYLRVMAFPVNSGLVAYYALDQTAADFSGNGEHGTVMGAVEATADRSGRYGRAFSFPGQGDSYVDVDGFDTSAISTALTMNVWLLMDGGTESPRAFSDFGTRAITTVGNGNPRAVRYHYGNAAGALDTPLLAEGEWHMITTVETTLGAKLYLDGELVGNVDAPQASVQFSPHFNIGRNTGGNEGWGGKLDEFRIYNRELSDSEIAALYRLRE